MKVGGPVLDVKRRGWGRWSLWKSCVNLVGVYQKVSEEEMNENLFDCFNFQERIITTLFVVFACRNISHPLV